MGRALVHICIYVARMYSQMSVTLRFGPQMLAAVVPCHYLLEDDLSIAPILYIY